MSESMKTTLNELCQKDIATASDAELYTALLKLVQEQSQKQIKPVTGRKLYYISAEFLIGKLLSNNLINLGLYDEVRETLASIGKSLADIEEQEPEPSLGNGGLGRHASLTVLQLWIFLVMVSVFVITADFFIRISKTTSRTKLLISG